MPTTTTFMTLETWPSPSDLFNYSSLAANFVALDAHDHTTGKGKQVPSGGIADNAVITTKVLDGAITAAKLATAVKPGTLLSSWSTVAEAAGLIDSSLTAGTTRYLTPTVVAPVLPAAGTTARTFHINPTDYAVTGTTTQWRVYYSFVANATNDGTDTLTLALARLSAGGGTGGAVTFTDAAAVNMPTVATAAIAASSVGGGSSSVQTTSVTAGVYALAVIVNSVVPAGAAIKVHSRLEVRHV